ncbi:MAG TPA: arginase family protein [Candidatus Polarisedimenticolia bacterium]|nr:arginase family protein [Candidatus Polarisedimenticolia bacterium]
MTTTPGSIVVVGSPTALGGHFAGMDKGPAELRRHGVLDRLAGRPGLAGRTIRDAGDVPNDPGWAPDPDPRAKNRALICAFLPRLAGFVADAVDPTAGDRLLVLGGDCTSHTGTMAGLQRRLGGARIAIAWFDAHGDFNTPDTTPSGNVWGMPFALICGRGEADLVAAAEGPTAREEDAALLGGQVLDETESRMLAASAVAQFGAGMLAGDAGLAALEAWATTVARRVDGFYIAFDLDALDDGPGGAGGWSVAMPEPDGISLPRAVEAVGVLAKAAAGTRLGLLGFGPTAAMPREDRAFEPTVDAVVQLSEAALSAPR